MINNKIVIAGGTGALGTALVRYFNNGLNNIIILTRTGNRADEKNIKYVQWDATNMGDWASELENADLLVNLVGKSVNCRYTEENKAEIIRSRVAATTVLGEAIRQCRQSPKLWVNAGSAAIFGNSGAETKNESSDLGQGFSPEVCKKWEAAFAAAETPETRKVLLRIGLVLQRNKGILKPFVNLAKTGLGGKLGSGKQYMTWIHEQDFVQLIKWLTTHKEVSGIIHAASPFPVRNAEFMQGIRKVLGVPVGLPNPSFLIKIGAIFIGTEAELVLSGRRVVSKVLEDKSFYFKYPIFEHAVNDLLA